MLTAKQWSERALAAESRIATLTAERDALREALKLLHDNIVQAFPSLANLGPVAQARALTTQPSKTETRE